MKRVVGLLFALTCANAQTTLKSGTNMGMAIAVIEQGKDAYFDSITKSPVPLAMPVSTSTYGNKMSSNDKYGF